MAYVPRTRQNTIVIHDLLPDSDYIAEVRASTEDTGVEGISAYQGPWSPALKFRTITETVPPKKVMYLTGKAEGSTFEIQWENPYEREDDRWLMNFRDFMIRIWPVNEPHLVQTVYTTSLRYILTVDMNAAMFGTAKPALIFEVSVRDQLEDPNVSEPMMIMLEIDPLEAPELVAAGGIGNTMLGWAGGRGHFSRYEVYRNGEKIADLGQGTNTFNDSDTRPGVHTYFVRCYDPFGRYVDTNTVEADVDPYDADFIAPAEPYDLEYADSPILGTSEVRATFSWRAPLLDIEGNLFEDFEGFELRYKTELADPWTYVRVVDDRLSPGEVKRFFSRHNIPQQKDVYWGVRALDRYNNYSSWASMAAPSRSGVDDKPPNKPSTPIVAGNLQSLQVRHDLRDTAGTMLPTSVQRLDIFLGHTAGFIPSEENRIGRASVNRLIRMGTNMVWSAPHEVTKENQQIFVKVIAVTGYPANSPASDASNPELIELIEDIHIQNATITDASVKNIGADKLTAGEGVIHDLDIMSKLLVGRNGVIDSAELIPDSNPPRLRSTFNATTRQGWRISQQGAFFFEGEMDAARMKIQDSANILEQGYSNFTYTQDWYNENISRSSSTSFSTTVSSSWSRHGNWSLRTVNTSGVNRYVYLAPNNSTYETPVEDGFTYIFSAYVKNTGQTSVEARIGYRRAGNLVINQPNLEAGQTVNIPPGQTRRISREYVMPGHQGGSSYIIVTLGHMTNGELHWDGIQVERQIGSSKTPSSYKVGGITEISGNMIRTGQIESNSYRSSGGTQGWAIPLSGNAIFNSGTFRGTIRADNGWLNDLTITGTLAVGSGRIMAGSTTNGVEISSSGIRKFQSGATTVNLPVSGNPTFAGQITGGSISIGSNAFQVNSSGELWMGGSTPTHSNTRFRVTNGGWLIARNATVQGHIEATSGSFSGSLSAATGTFRGDLTGTNMDLTGSLNIGSDTHYLLISRARKPGGSDMHRIQSMGTGNSGLQIWADGTIMGGVISGTSITGGTIQTRTSGSPRVILNSSGITMVNSNSNNAIDFHNVSSGSTSHLKQGNLDGIEFSGSIRVGGTAGDRVLYVGAVVSENWRINSNGSLYLSSGTQRAGLRVGAGTSGAIEIQSRWASSTGSVSTSTYQGFAASFYRTISARKFKEDIENFDDSVLGKIRQVPVHKYKLKRGWEPELEVETEYPADERGRRRRPSGRPSDTPEPNRKLFGFMLDELPEELRDGDGYVVTDIVAYLWKGMQELAAEVESLKRGQGKS